MGLTSWVTVAESVFFDTQPIGETTLQRTFPSAKVSSSLTWTTVPPSNSLNLVLLSSGPALKMVPLA